MKPLLFLSSILTLALACSGDGYYQHSNPAPSNGKGGSAGAAGATGDCVQGSRIQCSTTDPRCTQLCSDTGTWSSCTCGDITDPAFGGSSGF